MTTFTQLCKIHQMYPKRTVLSTFCCLKPFTLSAILCGLLPFYNKNINHPVWSQRDVISVFEHMIASVTELLIQQSGKAPPMAIATIICYHGW